MSATKTNAAIKVSQYIGLVLLNACSKSKLNRTPEPFALTDQNEYVDDYNKAIQTIMVLPYVLSLDMIQRVLGPGKSAVDLCCGPGHFTRMLVKTLGFSDVIGVDLSEPMLKRSIDNAQEEGLSDRLRYIRSDVSSLESVESKSMDLVTFMDGAHHMNSLDAVTQILKEADRVTESTGAILLLDPVRPKTQSTADLYHRIAGQPYVDLGMPYFNKDFYDSIHASWTADELFKAIPGDTKRQWVQLIPMGFPAFQMVIGLPEGRKELFANQGLSRSTLDQLIPKEWKADWTMLNLTFRLAKRRVLPYRP